MKNYSFILLSILLLCIGCSDKKEGSPPPLNNFHLDLANLWDMYYKDVQTVKNAINATFVSEIDTNFTSTEFEKLAVKRLIFKKDTPIGPFTITCDFFEDKLLEIYTISPILKSPLELLPYYTALSDEAHALANSSAFTYGYTYNAWVVWHIGNPDYKQFTGYGRDGRPAFLKYAADYVKRAVNRNESDYSLDEHWNMREFPAVYPGDKFVPIEVEKWLVISFSKPDNRTYFYINISSFSSFPYI